MSRPERYFGQALEVRVGHDAADIAALGVFADAHHIIPHADVRHSVSMEW